MKRSPMKRASVESVKAWRARTAKPLRQRSLKLQREYVKRRAFVAQFLAEHPRCQVESCASRSVDVHEPLTRARGGSIIDPENAMALCREHHSWIHQNPLIALTKGYLRRMPPAKGRAHWQKPEIK